MAHIPTHKSKHNSFRKPIIAGNWKMHGSQNQVKALIEGICKGVSHADIVSITDTAITDTVVIDAAIDAANVEIIVLPTFVHIAQVRDLLNHPPKHSLKYPLIKYGAQNLQVGVQGAFTGEVSGAMLQDIGCQYVLVGHSERRSLFHETYPVVAAKFKAAIEAGLRPILCIGETQTQREQGETEKVIREQLEFVIQFAGIDAFKQALIAYEPVWAIGTGLTASPEQAQAVHAFIRDLLAQNNVDLAKTICILYGGSMKPENAASLLTMPDIDGGLIGGASLDAKSFLTICAAASEKSHLLQNS